MSESPSVYIPRQLRPRRNLFSEREAAIDDMDHNYQNVFSANSNSRISSINTTGEGIKTVVIPALVCEKILAVYKEAAYNGGQGPPNLQAYLLGSIDSNGIVNLNLLDPGVKHGFSKRMPSTDYEDGIVVPIYFGGIREVFYKTALKPGNIWKLAGCVSNHKGGGVSLEMINIGLALDISVAPVSLAHIANLPSLLVDIRANPDIQRGPVSRDYNGGCNHRVGPLTPPESMVWIKGDSRNNTKQINDAYMAVGAPWSLHVVSVFSNDDYRTAQVEHSQVSPMEDRYRVGAKVGFVFLKGCTAKLTLESVDKCDDSYAEDVIGRIAANFQTSLVQMSSQETRTPAQYTPSCGLPSLVGKIAEISPACNSSGGFLIRRRQLEGDVKDTDSNDPQMLELLNEQRQIRLLLEEQNSLMRTHVTQTQALMRNPYHHQPSPQTITRRHLRMRGTYTPIVRASSPSDNRNRAGKEVATKPAGDARRSNSLSEIVDGIRSFVVEGYEETQHHGPTPYIHRQNSRYQPEESSSSFVTTPSTNEKTGRPSSSSSVTSTHGTSKTTGISSLVSRINHLVSDKSSGTSAFTKPPPMPDTYRRAAITKDHYRGVKNNSVETTTITPTTQKYLNKI